MLMRLKACHLSRDIGLIRGKLMANNSALSAYTREMLMRIPYTSMLEVDIILNGFRFQVYAYTSKRLPLLAKH